MQEITALCGANCNNCAYQSKGKCPGCNQSNGCPFGKKCFIYEYIKLGGKESFRLFTNQLVEEFNELDIPGMSKINELYPMNGAFVNLEYPMPGGNSLKLLDDNEIYLCNQVESEFNDGSVTRCFGLVAGMNFLLVAEYGENCSNPEIIIYKKR